MRPEVNTVLQDHRASVTEDGGEETGWGRKKSGNGLEGDVRQPVSSGGEASQVTGQCVSGEGHAR